MFCANTCSDDPRWQNHSSVSITQDVPAIVMQPEDMAEYAEPNIPSAEVCVHARMPRFLRAQLIHVDAGATVHAPTCHEGAAERGGAHENCVQIRRHRCKYGRFHGAPRQQRHSQHQNLHVQPHRRDGYVMLHAIPVHRTHVHVHASHG